MDTIDGRFDLTMPEAHYIFSCAIISECHRILELSLVTLRFISEWSLLTYKKFLDEFLTIEAELATVVHAASDLIKHGKQHAYSAGCTAVKGF